MAADMFTYLWVLFEFFVLVKGICHPLYGPVGVAECVPLHGYNKPQWATCLTADYIFIKSGGRHICEHTIYTYCYYQCDLEVHDIEDGDVSEDCACAANNDDESNVLTKVTESPVVSIPSWCLSPTGKNCSWYSDCLQKRYPCTQSPEIQFATDMCMMFEDYKMELTNTSRSWLDIVRQCQQVELVPNIRPWATNTCDEIISQASASNHGCFKNAFANAPSICDLEFDDMFEVFWTLKARFSKEINTHASFQSIINSLSSCPIGSTANDYWQANLSNIGKPVQVLRLNFTGDQYLLNKIETLSDIVAYQVSKQVASSAVSDGSTFDLFVVHIKQVFLPIPTFSVLVIFVSTADFDLSYTKTITNNVDVDLSRLANDFVNASSNGSIYIDAGYGLKFVSVDFCMNLACTNTTKGVAVPPRVTHNDNKKDKVQSNNKTQSYGLSTFAIVVIAICSFAIVVFVVGLSICLFNKIRNAKIQQDEVQLVNGDTMVI